MSDYRPSTIQLLRRAVDESPRRELVAEATRIAEKRGADVTAAVRFVEIRARLESVGRLPTEAELREIGELIRAINN